MIVCTNSTKTYCFRSAGRFIAHSLLSDIIEGRTDGRRFDCLAEISQKKDRNFSCPYRNIRTVWLKSKNIKDKFSIKNFKQPIFIKL